MRHAVFVRPGLVEWRDAPDPVIKGRSEAIVRPIVVGRCDLDVAFVRGLLPMPPGSPIGHEIIAEVVDVGEDAAFNPGDHVFVPAQISCGRCSNCHRGMTGRCLTVPFAASYGMGREGDFGGGLADLLRVPYATAMLTPVPSGVDPATLIGAADMGADAWRAIGPQLARHPGARVLVLGGMPAVIGLYAAGLAAALGASQVDYVDSDESRNAIAVAYGATLEQSPRDETYDLVIVANPDCAALSSAFAAASPGATIVSVTPAINGKPEIDTGRLYHKGVTWIIGRPDCRQGHDGIMHAWATCGFCADHIPTQLVDWDDAPNAWANDDLYVAAVRR